MSAAGSAVARQVAAALLMEPSGQLRAAAADTLRRMGTAAASFAAQVAALLKDSTPEVRSATLYALGHMGVSRCILFEGQPRGF